jgi:hypothetical protein
MDLPDKLEYAEGHATYRPVGDINLPQAIAAITKVVEFCRERLVRRLLIDVTALTGLKPPSLAERYQMVNQWAAAAGGVVKLVIVAPPDLIDPQKFGVTVAKNRGMQGNTFTSEAEALAWLLDPQSD